MAESTSPIHDKAYGLRHEYSFVGPLPDGFAAPPFDGTVLPGRPFAPPDELSRLVVYALTFALRDGAD